LFSHKNERNNTIEIFKYEGKWNDFVDFVVAKWLIYSELLKYKIKYDFMMINIIFRRFLLIIINNITVTNLIY
jgi:hypothetical protein